MTRKSNRTHPLDRDGDGAPGGSLPGNQTAPFKGVQIDSVYVDEADALPPQAVADDLADARTTPGDSPEKLEAIEREVDEANAAARAEAAEAAADDVDTFTPEEIAAGATPVVQEDGEGTAPAAASAVIIDPADPLVTVDTPAAPVAVRLRELRELVRARRLYLDDHGYSAVYGPPYVSAPTVRAWIAAGLAEDEPTAGHRGGIRVTAEARRLLAAHRWGQAA